MYKRHIFGTPNPLTSIQPYPSYLFVFAVPGDGECVGRQRRLRLRIVEMDDGTVVTDHVHLLDARNRVHRQLLQRRLQLLVIGGGRLVDNLLLATRRSLAADAHGRLQFLQLFGVHIVYVFAVGGWASGPENCKKDGRARSNLDER